jgi:uncharacterized protein
MKKILLDTNFLLVPIQFKIDIFHDLKAELFTLDSCIDELQKIAEKKSLGGQEARAALAMLAGEKIKTIPSKEKTVDKAILAAAGDFQFVATNDRELISLLKAKGVRIIRVRQKKLIIEE